MHWSELIGLFIGCIVGFMHSDELNLKDNSFANIESNLQVESDYSLPEDNYLIDIECWNLEDNTKTQEGFGRCGDSYCRSVSIDVENGLTTAALHIIDGEYYVTLIKGGLSSKYKIDLNGSEFYALDKVFNFTPDFDLNSYFPYDDVIEAASASNIVDGMSSFTLGDDSYGIVTYDEETKLIDGIVYTNDSCKYVIDIYNIHGFEGIDTSEYKLCNLNDIMEDLFDAGITDIYGRYM